MSKNKQITKNDIDNYKKIVGSNIQFYRVAKGLTQEGLAELVGISPTAMSSVELGKNQPKIATLLKLANSLDVDPNEFYVLNRENRHQYRLAELKRKDKEAEQKIKQADEKISKVKTCADLLSELYKVFKKI